MYSSGYELAVKIPAKIPDIFFITPETSTPIMSEVLSSSKFFCLHGPYN